jgi:uncharacterized membrane protein
LSRYDWLLFLHITGAFLLFGGAVIAGALNIAAMRSGRRPSEILLLFGLIRRIAVPAIGVGTLFLFVFGLWLVHEAGYRYTDTWVILALVFWVLATALGNVDGRYQRQTGELAQRLAGEGDAPSPELAARLRNSRALAVSYGSGLLAFVVLGLMIWKPGA